MTHFVDFKYMYINKEITVCFLVPENCTQIYFFCYSVLESHNSVNFCPILTNQVSNSKFRTCLTSDTNLIDLFS